MISSHPLFKQTVWLLMDCKWQIYSIPLNRYQIITNHFITSLDRWWGSDWFQFTLQWNGIKCKWKCNTLLTDSDWKWDFDLHIYFSHQKRTHIRTAQPHPCHSDFQSFHRKFHVTSFGTQIKKSTQKHSWIWIAQTNGKMLHQSK